MHLDPLGQDRLELGQLLDRQVHIGLHTDGAAGWPLGPHDRPRAADDLRADTLVALPSLTEAFRLRTASPWRVTASWACSTVWDCVSSTFRAAVAAIATPASRLGKSGGPSACAACFARCGKARPRWRLQQKDHHRAGMALMASALVWLLLAGPALAGSAQRRLQQQNVEGGDASECEGPAAATLSAAARGWGACRPPGRAPSRRGQGIGQQRAAPRMPPAGQADAACTRAQTMGSSPSRTRWSTSSSASPSPTRCRTTTRRTRCRTSLPAWRWTPVRPCLSADTPGRGLGAVC